MYMKIAIIDDSKTQRENIKEILHNNGTQDVIETYASIKEYEQDNQYFDLLLLDIELPGEDGIAYVNHGLQKNSKIIYITSHSELMINAFHENVIGFIPKEQLLNLLIENIENARQKLEKGKKYVFKTLNGNIIFEEKDILYFCFRDTIVYVKIKQEKELLRLTAKYLSTIKSELSTVFYQVSRNYVVNLMKIQYIDVKTHEIMMEDGNCVTVSRRLWTEFKGKYNKMRYSND